MTGEQLPSPEPQPESHLTLEQDFALSSLCDRYKVPYDPDHYKPQFDLPPGYVAGWVGGPYYGTPAAPRRTIYVGCSAEGEISS